MFILSLTILVLDRDIKHILTFLDRFFQSNFQKVETYYLNVDELHDILALSLSWSFSGLSFSLTNSEEAIDATDRCPM